MKVSQVTMAIIFATMGLAIIALGWARQLEPDQRTMVTIAGTIGVIGAIVFIISRRHSAPPGDK
jgi:hypothetical protein